MGIFQPAMLVYHRQKVCAQRAMGWLQGAILGEKGAMCATNIG